MLRRNPDAVSLSYHVFKAGLKDAEKQARTKTGKEEPKAA
jgi:hypothetical protein